MFGLTISREAREAVSQKIWLRVRFGFKSERPASMRLAFFVLQPILITHSYLGSNYF
jgi:hypothetical protein